MIGCVGANSCDTAKGDGREETGKRKRSRHGGAARRSRQQSGARSEKGRWHGAVGGAIGQGVGGGIGSKDGTKMRNDVGDRMQFVRNCIVEVSLAIPDVRLLNVGYCVGETLVRFWYYLWQTYCRIYKMKW